MQQARALLPQDANDIMRYAFLGAGSQHEAEGYSAPFFVIFWHLTIQDISFSAESYQMAIDKIDAMEKDVASWRTTSVSEQKAERKRLRDRADVLTKEKESQAALVKANVQKRLKLESGKWLGKCEFSPSNVEMCRRKADDASYCREAAPTPTYCATASVLLLSTSNSYPFRRSVCRKIHSRRA